MANFSKSDSAFMARALSLAPRGRFNAAPNPCVGCVIAAGESVVGEGWHRRAGGDHAEIMALKAAGDLARGATAYVTLEPCAHHGKTPPCSQALIDAGVARVVAAMADPFDQVAGQGFAGLRSAGIETAVGLMESPARQVIAGYLSRVERGRPRVRLKVAASLDGATAMKSGESQWITGPEARRDVQKLRAESGAVLTGVETVIADNPSLNVRADYDLVEQPLRVILDSRLRTPADAKLLHIEGRTRIYCGASATNASLEAGPAEIVRMPGKGRVDVPAMLEDLAKQGINDVLVECGPTLGGSFLDNNRVDELVIYQSPHIMGSETRPMFETPRWQSLDDRSRLQLVDVRRFGDDTRITATLSDARS